MTTHIEGWTADDCAEFAGIKRRTFLAYVYRPTKNNPAPQPTQHVGRTPLWDPEAIREWHANRPRPIG